MSPLCNTYSDLYITYLCQNSKFKRLNTVVSRQDSVDRPFQPADATYKVRIEHQGRAEIEGHVSLPRLTDVFNAP